jgi:hypothetical protein
MRLDPFTRKRLERFVTEFRERTGILPTLKDFADGGFSRGQVDDAIHDEILVELYVTLTNGTIVKGYKLHVE